jgi:hypothetical protein
MRTLKLNGGCRVFRSRITGRLLAGAALALAIGCRAETPADPAARIETEASEVARFLSGHEPFERLELADSVDLYVAPDGGGGRTRIAREQLRDPKAWQLESGGRVRSFVPAGLRTRIITAPGRYMNCQPSDLATRFPALARLPHVGVRLEPPRVKSCLETWNATFVFDTTGGATRLVAAVYDQWEW